MLSNTRILATAMVLSVTIVGCGGGDGPKLATVTGKVTLDDSPLAGAEIGFHPVESLRPSIGVTDAQGQYTLQYVGDRSGAVVGQNKVQIRRGAVSGEGIDPKKLPQELSEEYNDATTLTADVKPGINKFDFELKTMARKDGKKSAAPVHRP